MDPDQQPLQHSGLKKIIVRARLPKGDNPAAEFDRALARAAVARRISNMKKYEGHEHDIVLPAQPLQPRQFFFYATDGVVEKLKARFPAMAIEAEIEHQPQANDILKTRRQSGGR